MDAYEEMLRQVQLSEDYIWLIKYLFTEVLTPENSVITRDVYRVLGRQPKDFADYAREAAVTGVWAEAAVLEPAGV